MKANMKKLAILVVVAVMAALIPLGGGQAIASTLEVGRGKTYATIQDAVDAAGVGDTILVYPGTYTERVSVNQEVTISAARGRPRVEGGFAVTADNVTIEGFDVRAAAPNDVIHVWDASNVTIRNNQITGGGPPPHAWPPPLPNAGISVILSDDVTIGGNFINLTTGAGIWLGGTSDSTIEDNHVVDTLHTGILLVNWGASPSHHNDVVGNRVESSGNPWLVHDDGIRLGSAPGQPTGAHHNLVEDNHVSGAIMDGIRAILRAHANTIQNNKAVGNGRYDIYDEDACPSDNTWTGNKYNTEGGSAVCP